MHVFVRLESKLLKVDDPSKCCLKCVLFIHTYIHNIHICVCVLYIPKDLLLEAIAYM